MENQFQKFAILSLTEAKRLQTMMAKENIEVSLEHNEQTCTRGCTVTVEVHAQPESMPQIMRFLESENLNHAPVDADNWEAIQSTVYNPQNPTNVCPACQESFSTHMDGELVVECPHCGLRVV